MNDYILIKAADMALRAISFECTPWIYAFGYRPNSTTRLSVTKASRYPERHYNVNDDHFALFPAGTWFEVNGEQPIVFDIPTSHRIDPECYRNNYNK